MNDGRGMIVERVVHPTWQSSTYLVASAPGSDAFFVDAGSGADDLLDRAKQLSPTVTDVLITHRHDDHVEEVPRICASFPAVRVLWHPDERQHVPHATADLRADVPLSISGSGGASTQRARSSASRWGGPRG